MSKTSDENAITETSTGAKILIPAILENLKEKVTARQYNAVASITLLRCEKKFHRTGSHMNCIVSRNSFTKKA